MKARLEWDTFQQTAELWLYDERFDGQIIVHQVVAVDDGQIIVQAHALDPGEVAPSPTFRLTREVYNALRGALTDSVPTEQQTAAVVIRQLEIESARVDRLLSWLFEPESAPTP